MGVAQLLLSDQKYVVTGLFLKACKMLECTLNEMYLLLYFENNKLDPFNPEKLSGVLSMNINEVSEAFSSLISKEIITVEPSKDEDGRAIEVINLNGIEQIIEDFIVTQNDNKTKKNIYELFESELGRPISPMEYEIVESWLNDKTSEELIYGALKEAVYNGVKSFRYIDKIIYTWKSKGFKNMEDVKKHLATKDKKVPELFDYNWLEDEDDN